jgi:nickel/cobalt exporter
MSVNSAGGHTTRAVLKFAVAVAALLLLDGMIEAALAQRTPFGVPRGAPASVPGLGMMAWIFAKQSEFYRQFAGLLRAAKTDGSAVWGLIGVSFLYGVFHAAGPGHGKAVISSYVIANNETWRRGLALSFASAVFQAIVAIAVVALFAALIRATASTIRSAVNWIEVVSYSLIVVIGLRLLWVKTRALVTTVRAINRPVSEMGTAVTPPEALRGHQGCAHHDHHHGNGWEDHAHHAQCAHASAWGHAHAPEPTDLAGPGGWKRGLSAVVAVGLRPCSGAIIVLVFALAQGLFWAGVIATLVMGIGTATTVAAIATIAVAARTWAARFAGARHGYGILAMRAVEVGAAILIIAFGALLLTGYIASERLIGV